MTHRLPLFLAFPLVLALALGCSKSSNTPASVSGAITYKDQKVTAGYVTYWDADGGAHPIMIRPDGTYTGSDLPAGELQVAIETESAKGKRKATDYGGGKGSKATSPVPQGAKVVAQGEYVKIPKKYADKNFSKLTVTLKAGNNTQNFDLTD